MNIGHTIFTCNVCFVDAIGEFTPARLVPVTRATRPAIARPITTVRRSAETKVAILKSSIPYNCEENNIRALHFTANDLKPTNSHVIFLSTRRDAFLNGPENVFVIDLVWQVPLLRIVFETSHMTPVNI